MKATCTLVMTACLFLFQMELMGQTTPLAANGRLKIINRQLSNESGTAIQLRGMSSHGLQWFPQCYTAGSFQALANDWGADVFRAAMYVDEGGYTTDPTGFRARIVQLVNLAEQNGMYCIIDWHILNPGDPNVHTAEAISFFSYMAQQFAGKKNVIYEICNEPNGVQWSSIKSYAEQVIPAIRQYDSQGIILVGTPNYSGTPWDVLSNPLSGTNAYNVMYTYHFYSGSHYLSSVRSNMENVLANVPLFISEWGTSNYSGNGGNDYTSAQTWMDFLAGGNSSGIKVSWTNWNFADKDESSSALTPGACNGNAWNSTSTSGTWVKDHILHPADNFGTATPSVSITSPANNSLVTTGSSVTINASVSNATASSVQFYDGSSILGSDNTAPYSWTIAAIAAGSHFFTAKAVLSSSTITSTAVTITAGAAANQAPTVSLTAPANGTSFTAPATINFTATASDADGSIAKVEFYNGNTLLSTDATAPYEYSWTGVAAGTYSLTAKAYDNSNASTTSATSTVQVNAQGSTGGDVTGPDCAAVNSVQTFEVAAANRTNATSYSWWCTGSTQSLTPVAGQPWKVTISFGPSFTGGQVCVGINYSADPWYKQFCKTVAVCSGTPVPTNQAPTVSLTAPANNATYTAPATITLAANASDADGSISKVEFYNGTTLLGTNTTAPYTYSWTNVAAGNYTITAKAYDNAGATTTSAGVNVVVTAPATNRPPTVAITAPANNASYTAPASITITANASDADGSISKVEFYSNNGKLGEATAAPYSYSWTNIAAGTYSITAKATDNSNATTTSSAVSVVVNTPTTTTTSGIGGPDCAAQNSTLVYQLGAADRVNATGYSWWINGGSTQSITPGANGTVTINFGPYFTGGQLVAGVNYSAAPWYKQFTKNVTLCSSARTSATSSQSNAVALETPGLETAKTGYVYPSPSNSYFTFVVDKNIRGVTVTDGTGRPVYQTGVQRTGQRITFGEKFSAGTYFVQISYADASRKMTTILKVK